MATRINKQKYDSQFQLNTKLLGWQWSVDDTGRNRARLVLGQLLRIMTADTRTILTGAVLNSYFSTRTVE